MRAQPLWVTILQNAVRCLAKARYNTVCGDGGVTGKPLCGDFFAAADISGLEGRLRGVPCRSAALAGALKGVPWQEYFSQCEPQRMEHFFTTL